VTRIGWVDSSGGVAGDMLLGACLDAGADLDAVQAALDVLDLGIKITSGAAVRGGLGATHAVVSAPETSTHRRLADVLELLDRLDPVLAQRAGSVFRTLAEAEARVHRTTVDEVHFHEVGALDAIADVVGVVAALADLRIEHLVSSPIALGGGRVGTEHGAIPVPGPAVLELLRSRDAPAFGGPVDLELATPTGVALLTALADGFGQLPALRPERIGVGAGTRDPAGHANVVRLVIGAPLAAAAPRVDPAVVIETNVDDLDPRVWPAVLAELMAAGASDAWLTPILMKKGRPAHTLSVLAEPDRVETLERVVFAHTSTIGVRRVAAGKVALARETITVDVLGAPVRVKVAYHEGRAVSATPEYDDVAALAADRRMPVTDVLRLAQLAAHPQGETYA
jgi:uncharacterized protein (TIGR00299 family) protein